MTPTRHRLAGLLAAAGWLLAPTAATADLVTLFVPGAVGYTYANSVSGSRVVGSYSPGDGRNYGFVYDGSGYTRLAVPGAADTIANGVDGPTVVGHYTRDGRVFGFVYDGSRYTTLFAPDAFDSTYARAVSGSRVVGNYGDRDGGAYGFLYDGSTYTRLAVPGAESTAALGVDGGTVVGQYVAGGKVYGFVYDGSGYKSLFFPGAYEQTYAQGVSGSTVVGTYASPTSGTLGFVYDGVGYTGFAVPGAEQTILRDADGGTLVGYYAKDGTVYGFLTAPAAVPEPSTLALLALGAAGAGPVAAWGRRRRA